MLTLYHSREDLDIVVFKCTDGEAYTIKGCLPEYFKKATEHNIDFTKDELLNVLQGKPTTYKSLVLADEANLDCDLSDVKVDEENWELLLNMCLPYFKQSCIGKIGEIDTLTFLSDEVVELVFAKYHVMDVYLLTKNKAFVLKHADNQLRFCKSLLLDSRKVEATEYVMKKMCFVKDEELRFVLNEIVIKI